MKIKIVTSVDAPADEVMAGFTEKLFVKLSPPFPKVRLQRFDGSKTGDMVSLELDFLFFRQKWTSEIVSDEQNDKGWVFVDKGVELPFFLHRWHHRHEVQKAGAGANIVDDIEYSTGWYLTDFVMYPAMYIQFLYRKPIYRKFFKKK